MRSQREKTYAQRNKLSSGMTRQNKMNTAKEDQTETNPKRSDGYWVKFSNMISPEAGAPQVRLNEGIKDLPEQKAFKPTRQE